MTVSCHPEAPENEPFIRSLGLETVAQELQAASWPAPMREQLLAIQYTSRRESIRDRYPGAQSQIICLDGENAGWLVIAHMPDEIQLVEILLLERQRGQGAGTTIIRKLLSDAA